MVIHITVLPLLRLNTYNVFAPEGNEEDKSKCCPMLAQVS